MKFPKYSFFYLLMAGIVSAILFSCNPTTKQEQEKKVTITGKIKNPTGDSVFILIYKEIGWSKITHGGVLAEDGSFTISFELQGPEPASFGDGNETTKIFLHPGDSMNLTVDTDQFDETLKYSGTHAEENNYLAAKYLENEKRNLNYWKLADSLSAEDYLGVYEENMAALKSQLVQYQKKHNVSKEFISYENTEIGFDFATNIYLYISKKRDRKTGFDTINIPKGFYKHLDSYIRKEGPYKKSPSFKQFISFIPGYLIATSQFIPTSKLENDSLSISLVTTKLNGDVKEKAITNLLFRMLEGYDMDAYEKYREIFDSLVKNESSINYLDHKYIKVKNELAKGLPEGVILKDLAKEEYQNLTFHKIIDQYKGKIIYLDFWASWCGPCKAEMPASLKMQEYFKGKDVVFVYISSDRIAVDWERMVKILQITGEHYRASKAVKNEYNELFDVRFIPRYIIIGKEGIVVDDKAKRPSDKAVYSVIEGLL